MNACAPAGARGAPATPAGVRIVVPLLPGGSLRSPPANFLSPRWGGIPYLRNVTRTNYIRARRVIQGHLYAFQRGFSFMPLRRQFVSAAHKQNAGFVEDP